MGCSTQLVQSKHEGRAINERGRQLRQPQYATRYLRAQLSPKRCGIVFLGCMTVPITVSPMNNARVTAQKLIHMVFSLSVQRAYGGLVSLGLSRTGRMTASVCPPCCSRVAWNLCLFGQKRRRTSIGRNECPLSGKHRRARNFLSVQLVTHLA